tara:strand:- start:486 stop:701 length:216 start_codon:yes stop_codon:yes gene_type:complete
MIEGDLVRCVDWGSSEFEEVGVVVEYQTWEKVASVLIQSTGEVKRIPARNLQLIKRAPQNVEKLKKLKESS